MLHLGQCERVSESEPSEEQSSEMYHSSGGSEKRRASSPIRGSLTGASPLNSPPRRFSSPHQSSSAIHYSDRYIPSRTGSSLENSFDLMTSGSKVDAPDCEHSGSENSSTRMMNSLIRAELLGQSGGDMGGISHPNKILRSRGDSGTSPNVLRCKPLGLINVVLYVNINKVILDCMIGIVRQKGMRAAAILDPHTPAQAHPSVPFLLLTGCLSRNLRSHEERYLGGYGDFNIGLQCILIKIMFYIILH